MSDAMKVSPQEWDAWRSFTTMRQHLDRTLEQGLQSEGDLSAADFHVLIALFEAPDRTMRARDLSQRIGWERSRLSHQVTRMHKRGLLEKTGCDTDGRGTWIGLTPDGRLAVLTAMREHSARIRRYFFDVLSSDELATLHALSERVLIALDPDCVEPAPVEENE
ncbi:MAG: MarR family winged helix-turn-helix transcriptional regulator [Microbacteriaceae bacterium]